jgi:uncharacterized membrane protein
MGRAARSAKRSQIARRAAPTANGPRSAERRQISDFPSPSSADGARPPRRLIRSVANQRAFAWYADAMRLWKRAPMTFCAMALAILAGNVLLPLVPLVGVAIAQLVLPLVECGLLYASLAADRGDRPRLGQLVAFVGAPARAQAAVVAAALIVFVAEAFIANVAGGYNMLMPESSTEGISGTTLVVAYASGILVSLPVTFVPFAALFDGESFRTAFAQSGAAFARNLTPLVLYGALSFGLVMVGLVTNGIGLLLALPWSAAASYAAWKDIFGVA